MESKSVEEVTLFLLEQWVQIMEHCVEEHNWSSPRDKHAFKATMYRVIVEAHDIWEEQAEKVRNE